MVYAANQSRGVVAARPSTKAAASAASLGTRVLQQGERHYGVIWPRISPPLLASLWTLI